ncbi:MAG: Fe-S oxidoreductase [Deltaproteobacteria bacterium RBG_13_61_14]|nr:MAG: Fe-S oxidoreductase [Deltaproteobacteria bacterium RBG_13_61_14]
MEHAEILHRCFRCGYCKLPGSYQDLNCPSYLQYRFETYSPGGRMWLLRAWLDEEIPTSARLQEILFSCTACGNCVEHCVFPKFKADVLNAITAGRGELVNEGSVPRRVSDFFKAIHLYGNPYKLPEADRGAWAKGLGLEPYRGQEYLFFAGCAGSYDERGRKMARAVAGLLQDRGVSFGILGALERCDGNEVRAMGEAGLFEEIARHNIAKFLDAGVVKIITLSPHAYHAIRNYYPRFNGIFQVLHYSQVLARMMSKGKDQGADTPLTVTFHDPCYLGRHNQDYLTPRMVLAALPGVELAEMDRARVDALCCGGGGGNFFTDLLGSGPDSSSRVRVREAAATGAQVLAVACPKCAKMLEDAVKAEALESALRVMDLAELVQARSV